MLKALALAALAFAVSIPAEARTVTDHSASPPKGWTLDRVVVVMRHGIRPPTKAEPLPAGEAQQPWPVWDVSWGFLTHHGEQAIAKVADYDHGTYGAFLGLACPTAHDVRVVADVDQRTVDTAQTYADELFSGCHVPVEHAPDGQSDPRFSPFEGNSDFDAKAGLASAQASLPKGGLPAVDAANAAGLKTLNDILGCTQAACDLSQQPAAIDAPKGRIKLEGGINTASTLSEILALEYAEGKPMSEVGWGRADRSTIARLLSFHALEFQLVARPKVIADYAAKPLLAEIRRGLFATDTAKFTVLVGHDGNLANIGGALNLHWQGGDFAQDDPPPGGALIFELWHDKAGHRRIVVRFRSQTLDEMRNLTPLGADASKALALPQCGGRTDCDAKAFEQALKR